MQQHRGDRGPLRRRRGQADQGDLQLRGVSPEDPEPCCRWAEARDRGREINTDTSEEDEDHNQVADAHGQCEGDGDEDDVSRETSSDEFTH